MITTRENRCCLAYKAVSDIMLEFEDDRCITQTRPFQPNCLDKDVLDVSRHEYVHMNGPFGNEERQNE